MLFRQATYRQLLWCLAFLAHSYTLLWGAGHHLHILLEDHGPLVVHAHDQAGAGVYGPVPLHVEKHDHPVTSVVLTGTPARNFDYTPTLQCDDALLSSSADDCEEEQRSHALLTREAPSPPPLEGHLARYSGIDPPSTASI